MQTYIDVDRAKCTIDVRVTWTLRDPDLAHEHLAKYLRQLTHDLTVWADDAAMVLDQRLPKRRPAKEGA